MTWMYEEARDRIVLCHKDEREINAGKAQALLRLKNLLTTGPAELPHMNKDWTNG